jgi:hypothetical protein
MNKQIAALVLSLVVGACGGSESLSETVDTSSPADFCRAAAAEQCARMYSCLTDSEKRALDLPDSEEECARDFESACEDGAADCGSSYSFAPAAAAMCLDQMEAAVCNDAAELWLDAPACTNLCERTSGVFEIGWSFTGNYICADVNAATVVVVTEGLAGKRFEDRFDCSDYHGVTRDIPHGEYTVHLELLDSYGRNVYTGFGTTGRLTGARVDLGTITIPVGG